MQELCHIACLAVGVTEYCEEGREIEIDHNQIAEGVKGLLGPALEPYSQFAQFLKEQANDAGLSPNFLPKLEQLVLENRGRMEFGFDELGLDGVKAGALEVFARSHRSDPRTKGVLQIDLVGRKACINDPMWYAYLRWCND